MNQVFRSKFGWELFLPTWFILLGITSFITLDLPDGFARRWVSAISVGLQVLVLFP